MAASYPTSVKSFSAKASNDTIEPSHVNDLQDEVNAIETALITAGFAHALLPSANNTYALGSDAKRWSALHVTALTMAGVLQPVLPTTAAATDGQLLIGKTSDHTLNLAALTAGAGITVTNGAGTITIANSGASVLDRDVTAQDVVSTVAETTVYTFSVPGGTLGTNRTIRLSLIGDVLSAAARTLTLRVKYGATTVLTAAVTLGAVGARGQMTFVGELTALNATNAQVAKGVLTMSNTGADATGTMQLTTPTNGFVFAGTNSGVAEDSTAAKTLSVTFQNSAAEAGTSMRVHTVLLELI